MPESLIDLGSMTGNAIQLAQLAQYQRANDIRNAREQDYAKLTMMHQRNELLRNPLIEGTDAETQMVQAQLSDMGLPVLPSSELQAGRKAGKRFVSLMLNPESSIEERGNAYVQLSTHSPTLAKHALAEAQKMTDFDIGTRTKLVNIVKNEAQITKLNAEAKNADMRNGIYASTVGALNNLANTTSTKDQLNPSVSFDKVFQRAMKIPDVKDRRIYLGTVKGLTDKFDTARTDYAKAAQGQLSTILEQNSEMETTIKNQQAMNQPVTADQLEFLKSMETVRQANAAVGQWSSDPYNKEKWQQLQNAIQSATAAANSTKRTMAGLDANKQALLNLRVAQDERKVTEGQAQSFAQESFIRHLNQGQKDNQAAANAIAETRKQFGPTVALNAKDFINLEKKGQINLQLPQSVRADAYEAINAADDVFATTSQVRGIVAKNPSVVSVPGAFQRALAGVGQQLVTVMGQDPLANELLNTKPADEYEALQEILVFQVARAINGRGVLTEPDVNSARRIVGTLKDVGGPQQLMNKLSVIDNYVLGIKKRRQNVLTEGSRKEQPASQRPVEDMNFEDILKELGNGG